MDANYPFAMINLMINGVAFLMVWPFVFLITVSLSRGERIGEGIDY